MGDNKTTGEIHGYIRLALPLMSRQNIPVTPRNYAVWYKYVSGADGELSRTIDAMRERGKGFPRKRTKRFMRNSAQKKMRTNCGRSGKTCSRYCVTILTEVTELTGQTKEYDSFVSSSVNALPEDASLQEIRNVISEIVDKTKTLGGFGKTIQRKLKETTEALEVLRRDFEQVKTEAFLDFLTGIPNRKAFDSTLTQCTREAASDGRALSLLLIDIDHFKRFNDEHGHLIGDEVLRFVARKIKEIVRGRDFLARFGGEEFAVVLPQTPLAGAEVVAEGIRNFFAQATTEGGGNIKEPRNNNRVGWRGMLSSR